MEYILVKIDDQDETDLGPGTVIASECPTLEIGTVVRIELHGMSSDQRQQYQIFDDQAGLQYLAERGTGEGRDDGVYQYMVRPLNPWW